MLHDAPICLMNGECSKIEVKHVFLLRYYCLILSRDNREMLQKLRNYFPLNDLKCELVLVDITLIGPDSTMISYADHPNQREWKHYCHVCL